MCVVKNAFMFVGLFAASCVGTDLLGGATAQAAPPGAVQVEVANTPLPVSAEQSGAWGVEILNSENPALQPFGPENQPSCQASDSDGCFTNLLTVPAGKRLVIEYASVKGGAPAGQAVMMSIGITEPGGFFILEQHFMAPTPPAVAADPGHGGWTGAGQQVRIYVDPGRQVRALCLKATSIGSIGCQFGLSGHFVDVP